jgi:hypothetical protein
MAEKGKLYHRLELVYDVSKLTYVCEICALLGYYALSVVIVYRRFGTTYRSHLYG